MKQEKRRAEKKSWQFIDLQLFQLRLAAVIAAVLLTAHLLVPELGGHLSQLAARLDLGTGEQLAERGGELLDGAVKAAEQAIAHVRALLEGAAPAFSQEKGQAVSGSAERKTALSLPYRAEAISYGFGYRSGPFTGDRSFHSGVDYAMPLGTAVRPVGFGRVVRVGENAVYGNFVTVRHTPRHYSVYAHLDTVFVGHGMAVNRDTIIGRVGSTGRSTGYHLHLEWIVNGYRVDPLGAEP